LGAKWWAALDVEIAQAVTTNLVFKEWGKLFHNSAAALAIADRLVHKGILIKILGKSKRPNENQSIEVEQLETSQVPAVLQPPGPACLRALGRRLSTPALDRANRDPNAAICGVPDYVELCGGNNDGPRRWRSGSCGSAAPHIRGPRGR